MSIIAQGPKGKGQSPAVNVTPATACNGEGQVLFDPTGASTSLASGVLA